jgi:protein pelota
MRQLKAFEEGVRLRIDNADDLWTLAQICRVGSHLGMLSHRRDSTTGTQEGGRAKSAERKPMWIEIEVGETTFQAFTDKLRVHGVISDARIDTGSHHTHIVSAGDEVEVSFEGGLPAVDRALIKTSLAAGSRPKAGLIVVENDEVLIFEVTAHGIRDVSSFSMRGGGKRADDSTSVRRGFLERVARETKLVFPGLMPLVLCGPGMAREHFEAMLRGIGAENQILNAATSIGGRSAANEVLAQGAADSVLGEHELVRQVRAIEEALKRISVDGAVSYGSAAIADAAEQGAVETLVIDAALLRSDEKTLRKQWEEIVRAVETSRGEIIQSSVEHDAGQQLVGMGGAMALLRWKVD